MADESEETTVSIEDVVKSINEEQAIVMGGIDDRACCSFTKEKDDENVDNQYNHNFSNSYCICQRPYPDEEYEGNEEMIQCGLCEDWFHVETLYKYLNVSYLLDPEDTMEYYLALGEKKAIEIEKEENEALSEALSELPHSVASHIAAGVNYMKETLEEFLKKKHESGC
ncbi:hypothetical protein X801_06501, partial [Opisthorchis viverrini]